MEVQVVEERFLPRIDDQAILELKKQYEKFRKLQKEVLELDVDYGWPSGKRNGSKPSLYKSGAEKLTRLFGLVPSFELIKAVEGDDFIMYMFRCVLKTPTGTVVGEGYGSCNSKEKTHWNKNPWANQNTILKMAKKRAHVDAVLTGLGASNVFTQDLEDLEEIEVEEVELATQPQIRKLYALIHEYAKFSGKTEEEIKEAIKSRFNVEHLTELTKEEASSVISQIEDYILKHKEEVKK